MMGFWGISWTICRQSAPRCRQITIPTPHHSIFRMLFLTPNQHCHSRTLIRKSYFVSQTRIYAYCFDDRLCPRYLLTSPVYLATLLAPAFWPRYQHRDRG